MGLCAWFWWACFLPSGGFQAVLLPHCLQDRQLTKFLLGSFTVMSGLAMVTDASVWMVTRHGFALIEALVFRPLTQLMHWVWSEGVGIVMQAVPCFHRLLFVSWISVAFFTWLLGAVPSEVCSTLTLPAHELLVPTAHGWDRTSSAGCLGSYLLQPCRCSGCCLGGFQLQGLIDWGPY
jgi:hypothetical protein